MVKPLRIKFWPLKENRTVELEIEIGALSFNVELDLDEAHGAHDDLRDALAIVEAEWS